MIINTFVPPVNRVERTIPQHSNRRDKNAVYAAAMPPQPRTVDEATRRRLDELRTAGRQAAETAIESVKSDAPANELERLAWLAGVDSSTGALDEAIARARRNRYIWAEIGAALGLEGDDVDRLAARYNKRRTRRKD